ncbi:universal stress protein [Saccharopolyspora sp. NPDC000995]
MPREKQSVVVGVDGSEPSARAALWATAEAGRLGIPLHLLLVSDDPAREPQAEETMQEIADRCRLTMPTLELVTEVGFGHPAEELVHRSDAARLIVVGSHGHGAFHDALLGSISAAVATHAKCPVVLMRGAGTVTTGPVIVGVDDSPGSKAALHYAFDAANRRRCDLVAVQALPDAHFIPGPSAHPDRDEPQGQAEAHLAEQLAGWAADYPDVAVHQAITNEHPVQALCEAAQHAQLLVVGHRGHGGFAGLLLGSVARGVLHHAPCPVAVIRT